MYMFLLSVTQFRPLYDKGDIKTNEMYHRIENYLSNTTGATLDVGSAYLSGAFIYIYQFFV